MKPPSKGKREALDALKNETVSLFHRLRAVEGEIHSDGSITAGMAGVLRMLDRGGAQTVPQLARARAVTRQHIQMLVNRLAEAGLVELTANPAHKRSSLVQVSAKGQKMLAGMRGKEQDLLAQLPIGISKKDLRNAVATLRAVRELFESEAWKHAVAP